MNRDTLAFFGAWLCVQSDDTDYDEPRRIVHYYPIVELYGSNRELYADREGLEVRRDGAGGWYKDGRGTQYQLVSGSATLPIHTEIIPIPCPKVRRGIETRWRCGSWEKYLKGRGWEIA